MQGFSQIPAPFILILGTIGVEPLVKNLIFIGKHSTIDEFYYDSKVGRTKPRANS